MFVNCWLKHFVKISKHLAKGKQKLEHENHNFVIVQLIKGHYSGIVQDKVTKINLDLCIVIIKLCTNFKHLGKGN